MGKADQVASPQLSHCISCKMELQWKLTRWKTPQRLWPDVTSCKPSCTCAHPAAIMYVCFTLCHEDCLLSYNLVCHTLCVQRVTGHVPSLAWAACVLAPGAEVSGRRSESQELHKSGSLWKCSSLTGKCPSDVCSLRCWSTAEEVLDDSGDVAQWGAGS